MSHATADEPAGMPMHLRRDWVDPVAEIVAYRDNGEIPLVTSMIGTPEYLVTRYADVRAVLGDAATFSNVGDDRRMRGDLAEMSEEEQARMRVGNLLGQDPPEHTRLRRMLTREFTQTRMRRLRPRIAGIVDTHLDAMEAAGPPADLVADFALPIPALAICELLGVRYADRDGFAHQSNVVLDMSLTMREREAASRELSDFMTGLVRAARRDPGEDILGTLIRDHGEELSDDELTGLAGLLLVAGHETTSNMLALGTLALLRQPDQAAMVRDDDAAVRPAVEELLRWLSVVAATQPRRVTRDTEIRGTPIPAGSIVICALPPANRDVVGVENQDRMDVRRGAAGHVAFGHGVHHCLGAPLARMEMETAFPTLLRRFPTLAPAIDPADVPFRSYHFVYGLTAFPVTW